LTSFCTTGGTSEDGNVGGRIGPQVIAGLRSTLGAAKVTAQGVDYAANVVGYLLGGDPAGTTEMIRLANLASTKCPNSKIVLGGYSQGAQLVHDTAKSLTAAVTAKIVAGMSSIFRISLLFLALLQL
jgi:cutinase